MEEKTITQQIMELEHFKTLTPIQEAVLSRKNKNRDIIGISSTGSGKSHAFFMSIFENLDFEDKSVQAVISAPTRELAYQLYDRCKEIGDYFNVSVRLFTGGTEKKAVNEQPQIVIGTPGRLKDMFIDENYLRLDTAKTVVIDEADMTLEYGFLEDIDMILSKMDKKVQLMVFSATIPEALQPFLKKYLYDPFIIEIDEKADFQSSVTNILIPCKHKTYGEKLLDVLPTIQPYVCLIFANTNTEAAAIADLLRQNNYDLVELHGDLESRERMHAIKEIQSQKKTYIVASDIASRGIDIDGITHVISCGFPKDLKFYVHRAGRTGRANRDGICLALYHPEDENTADQLIKKGIRFEHQDVRNGALVNLKGFHQARPRRKKDPLDAEIKKIVNRKSTKVKPGYKKKQQKEIDALRRKRKRAIIQQDIARQKKERAKAKQRAKRNEE